MYKRQAYECRTYGLINGYKVSIRKELKDTFFVGTGDRTVSYTHLRRKNIVKKYVSTIIFISIIVISVLMGVRQYKNCLLYTSRCV